ncbi:MAG: hypothetical protein WCF16_09340 [Alphaproteobacteria bacterium]
MEYDTIQDPKLKKLFHHADMLLFDVYGMFRSLPPAGGDGGGGNFSIVLVLLCIVDGLATEAWPGRSLATEQGRRFKRLIRAKLPWGPEGKGKWVQKGIAADQLYNEFRNPLVHELGADKVAKSRPRAYVEPIIGKWGSVPDDMKDISLIDALPKWKDGWPLFSEITDKHGERRFKLSAAGLYWAVKRLAIEMAADASRSQGKKRSP